VSHLRNNIPSPLSRQTGVSNIHKTIIKIISHNKYQHGSQNMHM
jgi:hypothetical protein